MENGTKQQTSLFLYDSYSFRCITVNVVNTNDHKEGEERNEVDESKVEKVDKCDANLKTDQDNKRNLLSCSTLGRWVVDPGSFSTQLECL